MLSGGRRVHPVGCGAAGFLSSSCCGFGGRRNTYVCVKDVLPGQVRHTCELPRMGERRGRRLALRDGLGLG